MDAPLTEAAVHLAYRLILGRAPESAEMLHHALAYGTVGRLRAAFFNSLEFEQILLLRPKLVRADAPPVEVLRHTDDATALRLLATVGAAWDGVAPSDDDGVQQAADVAACLHRNGLRLPDAADGFELGCGAGRVTRHLAGMVSRLAASDASAVQLAAAQRGGIANLALRPADDLRFGMTEAFDLWCSFHALQHSPPPLIARALARAFAQLRPGGVAIFQLPTYAYGYGYTAADLARPPAATPYDDRHVLPQSAVFAIAAEHGCEPVELVEDLSVGPNALWRSTLFVLRKRDG